jgi:hypothetical protein
LLDLLFDAPELIDDFSLNFAILLDCLRTTYRHFFVIERVQINFGAQPNQELTERCLNQDIAPVQVLHIMVTVLAN